MSTNNKQVIENFITEIWNLNLINKLDDYISNGYKDHSLPPSLPANKEGLKQWIKATDISFKHQTIIEEMVCEDDKVIIKIKMNLKHIGTWRNIESTSKEISTSGYRYFKLTENKITEHWALIDGNAIETQLLGSTHGCKIQE